jgi:hypothetical protein
LLPQRSETYDFKVIPLSNKPSAYVVSVADPKAAIRMQNALTAFHQRQHSQGESDLVEGGDY